MTGSLAAFEIDAAADPLLGLVMIKQARTCLDRTPAASTPTAWLESLEALAHASGPRPDEAAATHALLCAEHAIAAADGPPPWPWVYPFDAAKLARTRASIAVRLGQGEQAARAFAESLPTSQPAPKQEAVTTLEVAAATYQRGEVEEAFTLALGALDIGINYNSERVLQQARRFRDRYAGPTNPAIVRFDDRLRTTPLQGSSVRIAITGHRLLPPVTEALISRALGDALIEQSERVTGISCLADGADALFAQALLDHGGTLIAIVPAAQYRDTLPEEHHPVLDRLLAAAQQVHQLPYTESTSEAHMAASEFMLTLADQLWAVWDGKPARGFGGTADVVEAARSAGIPVEVIWPEGAQRS